MITVEVDGTFDDLKAFLKQDREKIIRNVLNEYGKKGVSALAKATPKNSGKTASAWGYTVEVGKTQSSITWTNSSATSTGIPIVILLEYGHGTRQGGYVKGKRFINKAIRPIMDDLADEVWKEVSEYR